ncbi:MAG: hypothetical protein EA424_13575 [Planctomycetaceae bacterium]|nr:MAG: hypothetical protein EA424_13575 [Planctomycetaceae bacterium]
MSTESSLRKIGPALANIMRSPCPAGAANSTVPVVILCSRPGLKMLQRNHQVRSSSAALPYAALDIKRQDVGRLSRDRGIYLMEADERYATVPKPLPACGPRNADVYERYKVGPLRDLDGDGVKIMVQDSGFSPHPDIASDVRAIDCTGEGTTRDQHGHGMAIVSQLKAKGRYPGLVPKAQVTMARIFDNQMSTSLSRILQACSVAVDNQVHVVSMSYGGPVPNIVISMVMRKLYAAGIFLVAAAGNSGPGDGTLEYPAGYDPVLAVAAVDKQGKLASFSSRGRPGQKPMKPDIALEGVNLIMAKSPDGNMGTPVEPGYIAASGTSFACPIGACLAAMILQARGTTSSPAEVAELLRASAQR